jgi:hypothetical protein
MAPASGEHRPTVQILHKVPDGSAHVDWLLARDAEGRELLITFRLPRRVDELRPGEAMDALRIADHRPAYLDYEGPISGGRGTVKRLRAGTVNEIERDDRVWILDVLWEDETGPGVRQRLRLEFRGRSFRVVAEYP